MLYGRATERSIIDRLLADARAGRSSVLVIRGEPGIGKTALLDDAEATAGRGRIRVLRGAGVESEAELPFAGLHLLLGSVLDRRLALPQPQRNALGAAFGLRHAGPYDRFLVGLAVLSLLAELAEDGPLLCLIDDAHWLDRASGEALLFAARRLHAEGIALLFAARDDAPFPAPGLPELPLGGLDAASAAALLADHGGADLPPEVHARILAEADGNPLGLIELSAAYRDTSPSAAWPGSILPLTDRLRQAFEGQVRRLPEHTQTLLLAAAVEESGDVAVVLGAARALGVDAVAIGPAEQARLVRVVDDVITFRHPLVRAAVYYGATLSRRLAVHRALADALRGPVNADRRAWHRAAAATEPDEEVAAELERTAAEATARSGHAAAAAAYERAVQLTTDPTVQARRLMLASEARAEIGEFDRARSLAARAAVQTTDPILQARLASVRALADFGQGRLPTAYRLLLDGAVLIGARDRLQTVRMLMNAMHIAWFLGDRKLIADAAGRLTAVNGSVAQPLTPLVHLMLWSAAQAVERPTHSLPPLAEIVADARRARANHRDDLAMVALVSLVTGRNSDARDIAAALVSDAREQGRIGWLAAMLTCLAQALVFDGRLADALATATEALRIAQDTGQPQWAGEANALLAYLAAIEGDEERCRRLVDAALADATLHATSAGKPWAHWALSLLDLSRGRPDTALDRLEALSRGPMRHHGSAVRSIPDLVEAAVRLGQQERATEPLVRFSNWARRAGAADTHALAERCQALIADAENELHYLKALRLHDGPFERARTQLLYGAWLRRSRRKAEARTQLRAALDGLDRIDAAPWAEQARTELSAIGVRPPPSDDRGLPRLTPQELQVARLAAQGLSNRDIAAQLFLSPRTVGYHLYKAYPKLGITSRSELELDMLTP